MTAILKQLLAFLFLITIVNAKSQSALEPLNYNDADAGTSVNPFQISSLENLYWLSQSPEHWDKYFLQMSDIDATETIDWNSGAGWTPIGNQSTHFTGNYNGQGKVIIGLYINRPAENYISFFGFVNTPGTITNVGLYRVNITGMHRVGGLVGLNFGTISNCFSTGSIYGDDVVGGLIGGGSFFEVTKSYSICTISGARYVGGFIGHTGDYSNITDCYARGSVSASGESAGGFIGWNTATYITNSYSTGAVSGTTSRIGGFVGYNYSYGGKTPTYTSCFWDNQTSGMTVGSGTGSISGSIIGKTTAEMHLTENYTDWDFENNWDINKTESSIVLHMNMEESELKDHSKSEHPTILNGNLVQDKTVSKFGEGSAYFDGLGTTYLSIPIDDDFNWGTNDFTIDYWVRFSTLSNLDFVSATSVDGTGASSAVQGSGFNFYYYTSQNVILFSNKGEYIGSTYNTWSPSANTWYHVAGVRDGDTWKVYIDGNQVNTENYTGSVDITDLNHFFIGPRKFKGNIDEIRISKGIAQWASNFTPPAEPYSIQWENDGYPFFKWQARAPIVLSLPASNITFESASANGSVIDLCFSNATEHGHCWSTSENPIITANPNITQLGNLSDTSSFTSLINGLIPNTTYYIKAYATNSYGTSYGKQIALNTEKIELTVSGSTAENKIYDGNSQTVISNAVLIGVINEDDVELDALVGTFDSSNVGNDINISANLTLKGDDIDKYSLIQPTGLKANITEKELSIAGSFTVNDKDYDGTVSAVIDENNLGLFELVEDDIVVLIDVVAEFSQVDVGVDISVGIESANLSGTDMANYTLSLLGSPTTTADIVSTTDIIEGEFDNISIYPNPFDNYFSLKSDDNILKIIITNAIGRKVFEMQISDEKKINLEHLPSGVYFLNIELEKNKKLVYKLIKNK